MASACVNNVGLTPAAKFSSFAWLSPPRLSFTRDRSKPKESEDDDKSTDLEDKDDSDFEFRLDDPVPMLPADELISDGKLMPMTTVLLSLPKQPVARRIKELSSSGGSSSVDPNPFSPRAPRCACRWKEIFGLKKLHQNSASSSLISTNNKSLIKNLLNRNSKSSTSSSDANSSLGLPLLRDSDCESLSVSSRLSLSSSSSGHEIEDVPRLSLDVERHSSVNPISLLKSVANSNSNNQSPPPRIRLQAKPRQSESVGSTRMGRTGGTETVNVVYADSPRMNSSGKIVFHGLERSSSSPGSFIGGPRTKHSGMERSYSANVRVTPVLNVPVCSLSKSGNVLGLGQLFSNSNGGGSSSGGNNRSYQSINNSRRRVRSS